jgi:deoxyribodipyrimidine photo-lyase
MTTAIVLFTRDLRVRDHPALVHAAAESERVLPVFVLDRTVLAAASPNRVAFLVDALADLRESLQSLGGTLVVRSGDVVAETVALARQTRATSVHLSDDVSGYAHARHNRLRTALATDGIACRLHPGVNVVPPGELAPAGGRHYRVFTPYWRRWAGHRLRRPLAPPPRILPPPNVDAGPIPRRAEIAPGATSPALPRGGETAGRRRFLAWLHGPAHAYERDRDALGRDVTSRLSPYFHFGCLSPLAAVVDVMAAGGPASFVRQLAWRDFFHQLIAANPELQREDMRLRRAGWLDDPEGLDAWRQGNTGYPLVDAGMRQLRLEGSMHGRARLVTASFLTKTLGVDWREGADHFARLLVDADVACNIGNWQWVAGTGADTRPNRIFNPVLQARRYDPNGDYVRHFVPELASVTDGRVHEPWRLGSARPPAYPDRVVIHEEAAAAFRHWSALQEPDSQ